MKKILTALCICLAVQTLSAQKTTLTGLILHPAGDVVTISWEPQAGWIEEEPVVYQAEVGSDGKFRIEFELDRPREVILVHGRERTTMYLYPREQVSMKVDTEQFDETLEYKGAARSASASNLMAQMFLFEEQQPDSRALVALIRKAEPQTVIDSLVRWRDRAVNHAEGLARKLSTSDDGAQRLVQNAHYQFASRMLEYPMFYRYFRPEDTDGPALPEGYYDFLKKYPVQQESALDLVSYRDYVLTYLDYKYSQANEDADMTTFKRAVITQELKGRVRQLVEARLLSAALDGNLTKEVENWMAEFASNGDNAAMARSLSAKLALARRLAPGQPAPVISMQRRDGTSVTWADLAGKVVYLDFWASWCGPCRQEMPYSHALIERMGEENVAFVYLSIDQDTKAWRKGLKDLGLEEAGVQLWTPEIEETGTAFAFDGIPTYYILDTKGNIFMRNAPRPSDPEAEVQIRAALEMNR